MSASTENTLWAKVNEFDPLAYFRSLGLEASDMITTYGEQFRNKLVGALFQANAMVKEMPAAAQSLLAQAVGQTVAVEQAVERFSAVQSMLKIFGKPIAAGAVAIIARLNAHLEQQHNMLSKSLGNQEQQIKVWMEALRAAVRIEWVEQEKRKKLIEEKEVTMKAKQAHLAQSQSVVDNLMRDGSGVKKADDAIKVEIAQLQFEINALKSQQQTGKSWIVTFEENAKTFATSALNTMVQAITPEPAFTSLSGA